MKTCAAIFCLWVLLAPAGFAGTDGAKDYPRQIIGRWEGDRKYEVYYADGTWAVMRNEASKPDKEGRRWHIEGDKLTLTFPGGTTTETIVSMSHAKFVTRDEGYESVRTRVGK